MAPLKWVCIALLTRSLVSGRVTSSSIHVPPSSLICGYSIAALDGLRAVARTWWPARRTVSARTAPRPDDEPVMSQVCWGIVAMDGVLYTTSV